MVGEKFEVEKGTLTCSCGVMVDCVIEASLVVVKECAGCGLVWEVNIEDIIVKLYVKDV